MYMPHRANNAHAIHGLLDSHDLHSHHFLVAFCLLDAIDATGSDRKLAALTESVDALKLENVELRRELSELQEQFNQVSEDVKQLRYDLGES